jgi:hypothetical protein
MYDFDRCAPFPSDDLMTLALPSVSYDAGFYGPEKSPTGGFEWSGPAGKLSVQNTNSYTVPVWLRLTAFALDRKPLTIELGRRRQRVTAGPQGVPIDLALRVPASGVLTIALHASGGVMHSTTDPRVLAFRINDPIVALGWCSSSRSAPL